MIGKITALTALAWASLASGVMAAPCDGQNIQGVWKLESIRAAEPGVEAFYARVPHEWMRFGADGGFMYVASNQPKPDLADVHASLDRADAGDRDDYVVRWPAPGQMLILRSGQPFQLFQCEILERPEDGALAGGMVLGSTPGAPLLRRVQRWIGA